MIIIFIYISLVCQLFSELQFQSNVVKLCATGNKMVSLLKNYVKKYSEENVLSFNDVEIIQSSSCVLQDE